MEIDLVRLTAHLEKPQGGVLMFNGIPTFLTLELPDLDNIKNKSCIPTGKYKCVRGDMWVGPEGAKKLLETFLVKDVPGRDGIGIHPANYARELRGCIGLGYIINFDRKGGIGDSRRAFGDFMEMLKGVNEFTLFVTHI